MKVFEYLYVFWVCIVFTVWMIILLPFFIVPYIFGTKIGGNIAFFFLKVWAYIFSWFTFIRYKVNNRAIMGKEARVIIMNHTSFLDAPGFAIATRSQARPLGKKEMTKFPIFGWLYRMNVVMVDRSDPKSRRQSLQNLKDVISKNISILIFPEGRMNRGDTMLQPFYNGAFRLSVDLGIPIQPLVIENAINLMPRTGSFKIYPGKINLTYLDPVYPEDKSHEELKDECYDLMYNFLNREKK